MTVMETRVAAVEIEIDGVRLSDKEMESLNELRLDQNLMLPDAFSITLADPEFEFVDAAKFDIGKRVVLKFCAPDGRSLKQVFEGEITALEPEFTQGGISLTIRGYDMSHRLNRVRKTDTFQDMSADQIAKKIAQAHGLTPRAEATGVTKQFTQQSNETDWEFLWRLASMFDFEVVVEGKTLFFREAGGPRAQTVDLRWAESRPMLLSLRPRVTAVQQIKDVEVRGWDPKQKKEIVAKAAVTDTDTKIGIDRSTVVNKFGGGTLVVADAPVTTMSEARKLARSFASQLANAWCEADGSCEGDPRIVPGTKLKIAGVGRRFNGQYVVSKAMHAFRGGSGYVSKFVVAGRSSRSLLDLVAGGSRRSGWSDSIVLGVVTNTKDPDKLGRVRIKFPALDGSAEGWWARIASVGAGKDRGQLMLPLVGDEVLVAFEGGDAHKPYVLGTLWNGRDTPGELVHEDGSYHLKTDKQILMAAKEDVTIKTDKNLTVEIKGDASETVDKGLKVKVGASEEVSVTQAFNLEAGTELVLKCGQATIKLTKMGQIEIKGAMVQMQGSGPVTIKGATVAIN
jgi:phage protein D